MPFSASRGRWARRLALPFVFGLLLTFVPLPQFMFASASMVDRLPLPTLSEAGASELSAVQAALDAAPTEDTPTVDEVASSGDTTTTTAAPATTTTAAPTTTTSTTDTAPAPEISSDRVSGTAADVHDFTAIGVLLDTAPTEPIMVRIKGADGNWGEWRELAVETDEGPDAHPETGPVEGSGAPYGTEPLWVDDATGYQLNVSGADAPGARIALVRDQLNRSVTDATPLAGAAVTPPFGIHLRAEWGARPSETSAGGTIKLAVVHHSASSNAYTPADVPGVLRSIQAYHMDGRGWSDIAYNFVVDKYGGVWEGRGGGIDRPIIGAHAMGFNTNSVGVMVIGDYTQATPTSAALESVSRVIGWKMALHNVDPAGSVAFTSGGSTKYDAGVVVNLPRVVGHQELGLTSCPGSIEGYLQQIRDRAQDWTTWVRATMGPQGSFDVVVAGADGTMTSVGWVVDQDVTGSSEIVLRSQGQTFTALANLDRPDIAALYPDQGPDHGFWVPIGNYAPGWHEICITAVNRGTGQHTDLGCRSAVVPDASGRTPVARVAPRSAAAGSIEVSGWATSADGVPATAQLTVDGAWQRNASGAGYAVQILGISEGLHQVCVVVEGIRVGCASVWVGGAGPVGRLDGVTGGEGIITTAGWAYDPESLPPIVVSLIIDGQWHSAWANRSRGDWATAYPGYADQHGFSIAAQVAKGTHWTCVFAHNVAGGTDTMLGCQNVVVK